MMTTWTVSWYEVKLGLANETETQLVVSVDILCVHASYIENKI